MRMAFFAARPTSTMRHTWVRMLLSKPRRVTPIRAESTLIGTIRMLARGRLQLSYCAARARNTKGPERGKMEAAVLRVLRTWDAKPDHSQVGPGGGCRHANA